MSTFTSIKQAQQEMWTSGAKTRVRVVAILLYFVVPLGSALPVLAQTKPVEPREQMQGTKYESVAPGMVGARVFTTDAQRDVIIEVKDFILGPGKSVPDVRIRGIGIMELKSGEIETTIDGHTIRHRPGDHWVVRPDQPYSIKNLGGQVVIHAVILTRK